MIATRLIRNAASTISIHNLSYEDLNNAMGEARLLLARLGCEREDRLNYRATQEALDTHKKDKSYREQELLASEARANKALIKE